MSCDYLKEQRRSHTQSSASSYGPREADDVEGAVGFPDPGQCVDQRSATRARSGRTARAGLGCEADGDVRYWPDFSATFPKLTTIAFVSVPVESSRLCCGKAVVPLAI